MIGEDIPCEDVLALNVGDADQTIASFTKAVERFANMK